MAEPETPSVDHNGKPYSPSKYFITGLRGQGASAEFGPEPMERCGLLAKALIEAAPGGIGHYHGLRKRLGAIFD
jgi:hypothetical protein